MISKYQGLHPPTADSIDKLVSMGEKVKFINIK